MWGPLPSPVTRARFRGLRVHVKRDDALLLAGNKVRLLRLPACIRVCILMSPPV